MDSATEGPPPGNRQVLSRLSYWKMVRSALKSLPTVMVHSHLRVGTHRRRRFRTAGKGLSPAPAGEPSIWQATRRKFGFWSSGMKPSCIVAASTLGNSPVSIMICEASSVSVILCRLYTNSSMPSALPQAMDICKVAPFGLVISGVALLPAGRCYAMATVRYICSVGNGPARLALQLCFQVAGEYISPPWPTAAGRQIRLCYWGLDRLSVSILRWPAGTVRHFCLIGRCKSMGSVGTISAAC